MLGVIGLLRTMGLLDIFGRTARPRAHAVRPQGRAADPRRSARGRHRAGQVPGGDRGAQAGRRARRATEYDIVIFATEHRADTVGYALVEHIRLGRFNPERARELGVPEGPLWGRIHKGETVTLPDGRRVGPAELVGQPAAGPHGGLSRATPGPVAALMEAPAAPTCWSTRRRSATRSGAGGGDRPLDRRGRRPSIAREAGVRRLVLTHISRALQPGGAGTAGGGPGDLSRDDHRARDGMELEVPFRAE